jgi:hypothetical protein
MDREKCCANCEFFEPRNNFCRRFPPKPIVIDTDKGYNSNNRKDYSRKDFIISKYPVVSMPELDWCGEFNEKGKEIL